MSSPNSVSHEIANVLRQEILRGQYKAGERLPSERDLSARFDVSRGAIREALSQLEQQGITETQPGGVRIKPVEQATLAILGPLLALKEIPDAELVDQFLEIFSMLTSLTAKGAVDRATPDQMNQMKQMLVELKLVAMDFEAMQIKWHAMMDYMAGIDDNLVARLIGNGLKTQFEENMMNLEIKPRLNAKNGQELVQSLEIAFNKKDGNLSAKAMESYFDQIRFAMRDALEDIQPEYRKQAM